MPRLFISSALVVLTLCAGSLHAQKEGPSKVDLAVTYSTERAQRAGTSQSVWLQGGSIELGADMWRGFGIAADVTGLHTSSIAGTGVSFSEVVATFGPRYRWHNGHRLSAFGEALVGEGDAFYSLVPGQPVAQSSTNSLALKIGGGADYAVSQRVGIRVLDVAWSRTQFTNSTDAIQNDVRIGAGVVVKFGH